MNGQRRNRARTCRNSNATQGGQDALLQDAGPEKLLLSRALSATKRPPTAAVIRRVNVSISMFSGCRTMARFKAVLAAIVFLLCSQSVTAADWDVQSLMLAMGQRSVGHARFIEKKYLAVLDEPIEQRGELTYAPGRLEKLTLSPKRERVLIDGDALTIETENRKKPRRLRLQSYPVLWGFVESMRATLTGDLATLQHFYAVQLNGPRHDWELVLAPRVQALRAVVELIRIRGNEGRIEIIEVNEALGDRTVMQVFEAGS